MFVLVTGGSGSGKSEYAEGRVLGFGPGERLYLATMMCFDQESRRRVDRHRKMREGKGFTTVERYLNLKEWVPVRQDGERQLTVLLECMSNLAANEIFDPQGSGTGAAEEIKAGIDRLVQRCDHLVVVTNEVFSDGIDYGRETGEYLRALGEINGHMASLADEVVEVVYGIPVTVKKSGRTERERKTDGAGKENG